jgi:hypothetical protein
VGFRKGGNLNKKIHGCSYQLGKDSVASFMQVLMTKVHPSSMKGLYLRRKLEKRRRGRRKIIEAGGFSWSVVLEDR